MKGRQTYERSFDTGLKKMGGWPLQDLMNAEHEQDSVLSS